MREIKFRIWSKIENEYAYMKIEKEIPVFVSKSRKTVLSAYWLFKKNNKLVVEQYTGLKNIHGVEIYEGDEIEFNGTKGKVEWDNNTASFRFKSYTSIYSLAFSKYNIINIEVIGNIHER